MHYIHNEKYSLNRPYITNHNITFLTLPCILISALCCSSSCTTSTHPFLDAKYSADSPSCITTICID